MRRSLAPEPWSLDDPVPAAVIVIPARDEEERIGQCLRALAAQDVPSGSFEIIVVLDGCRDGTARAAAAQADALGLALRLLETPGLGPGPARKIGMDAACERLLASRPHGLIACTDADSCPAVDWLRRQHDHVAAGARAIAGQIELDETEAVSLPPAVLRRRRRDAEARLGTVRRADPRATHHHAAGASLSVTAATYAEVGGIEALTELEDAGFAERLDAHGVELLRASDVLVRTSARSSGRVRRGLSVDLAVSSWFETGRFRASDYDDGLLRELKGEQTVTVVIPTKECAETIHGVITRTVGPLVGDGIVDDLVVIDAASADGTAALAALAGARVLQQDEIRPELGPALGKGDAMWRALQATDGAIVCFLDGDTKDPDPDHVRGLLGPLLADASLMLVKGAFERPFELESVQIPHEGGRVTELMARPLLNLHEPRLAGFAQPLAGEVAARRELLRRIAFPVGYGVEIAMLVDALALYGLDALAESYLGTRQNRHQPLRDLGEMAYAVLVALENRLHSGRPRPAAAGRFIKPWEDARACQIPVLERPPLIPAPAVAALVSQGPRPAQAPAAS